MRRAGQPGWRMVGGYLSLMTLLMASRGLAAEERNLILDASLGGRYDDNLFRLPEQVSVANGRGDTIVTPSAKLGYEQSFSKQRGSVVATLFSPRYQQHDTLNYHGYRISTAWHGQVGKRWQPSVSYMKSYELSSYEDVQAGIMDMLHRQRFTTGLFYGRSGRMRLGTDGWLEQKRHGSSTYEPLDLDDSGVGLQSEFASHRGSKVLLRYESQWIKYQQAVAQILDYRLDKFRLSLMWPASETLELSAVGGFIAWHFDQDGSDQHTWLGGTKAHWLPSDKWDVELSYQRDSKDPGYNIRVAYSDTLALEAGWGLTPKLRLEGRVSQVWSQYGVDNTRGQEREDDSLVYRAGLNWQPTETLSAQPYWMLGHRNSNQPNTDYNYQQIGVTFTYSY